MTQEDVHGLQWKSMFIQSVTVQFDHQNDLLRQIGFNNIYSKENLTNPNDNYYPQLNQNLVILAIQRPRSNKSCTTLCSML